MICYMTLLETDPDRERFVRIYRANSRRMSKLASQILGPGPKAEDAVHDAFLKFIQHFDELRDRPEDCVAAWLAVVVKNTALDMLRKARHETALEDVSWEAAVPADQGEFHALVASSEACLRTIAGCWSCGLWRSGAWRRSPRPWVWGKTRSRPASSGDVKC